MKSSGGAKECECGRPCWPFRTMCDYCEASSESKTVESAEQLRERLGFSPLTEEQKCLNLEANLEVHRPAGMTRVWGRWCDPCGTHHYGRPCFKPSNPAKCENCNGSGLIDMDGFAGRCLYCAKPPRTEAAPEESGPTPAVLKCPKCQTFHIDKEEWATAAKPHHKHLCESCGNVWDSGFVSVGVAPDLDCLTRAYDDLRARLSAAQARIHELESHEFKATDNDGRPYEDLYVRQLDRALNAEAQVKKLEEQLLCSQNAMAVVACAAKEIDRVEQNELKTRELLRVSMAHAESMEKARDLAQNSSEQWRQRFEDTQSKLEREIKRREAEGWIVGDEHVTGTLAFHESRAEKAEAEARQERECRLEHYERSKEWKKRALSAEARIEHLEGHLLFQSSECLQAAAYKERAEKAEHRAAEMERGLDAMRVAWAQAMTERDAAIRERDEQARKWHKACDDAEQLENERDAAIRERADAAVELLRKLACESKAHLSLSTRDTHGVSNIRALEHHIANAECFLATQKPEGGT